MKVYIVMADNGESYEDYAEHIVSVHSTKEKAVAAIKAKGFKGNNMGGYEKEVDKYGWTLTLDAWIVEEEVDA